MKKNHLNKKALTALMLALAAPIAVQATTEINATYFAGGGCGEKVPGAPHSCGACSAKTEDVPAGNSDGWKNNAMKRNNAAQQTNHNADTAYNYSQSRNSGNNQNSETAYESAPAARNAWNNANPVRANGAPVNPNGSAMNNAGRPAANNDASHQSQEEMSWNQNQAANRRQ